MEKVTKPEQIFPDVEPRVRPDGDAVVELKYGEEVVGEINFTQFFKKVGQRLGLIKKPDPPELKSVP